MYLRPMLALVLILTVAGCGGSSPTEAPAEPGAPPAATEAVAEAPTEAPAEPTEAPAAAAGIGVPVAVGDSEWTVDSATDKGQTLDSGNEYSPDLTTTGRFIQVDLRIKGTGSDPVSITSVKIKDSQGREFGASSDAIMITGDKSCVLETVNPGLEAACTWVYEVPADATGLALQASTGLFGSAVPIDLGQ